MSGDCESLETQWQRRIQSSPDAEEARNNLKFHRTKIRELNEQMRIAEEYEAELEKTLSDVEERLKPPVMRFVEKLNLPPGVDELLAHDVVTEVEDPSAIVAIMKEKANTGDHMTRVQLMSFMRTILNLRNCFNDEGIGSGVDVMQDLANTFHHHLGRPTINWSGLSAWEVTVMRQLIREVEGVPGFVVRLMDHVLANTVTSSQHGHQESASESR